MLDRHPVEPHARRRAAEQVIVSREHAPDLARVALGGAAIDARDAEFLERDALAVEHAEHVVIGREQQAGRIGEVDCCPRTISDRCARAG